MESRGSGCQAGGVKRDFQLTVIGDDVTKGFIVFFFAVFRPGGRIKSDSPLSQINTVFIKVVAVGITASVQ